eukprot:gene11160-11310_t
MAAVQRSALSILSKATYPSLDSASISGASGVLQHTATATASEGHAEDAKAAKKGAQKHGSRVIRGLRVRMGVATGCVPPDVAITRCALFHLAKGVSELAHGGQVLLEAATFEAVRDRLSELGIVDHKGYYDKLLGSVATAPRFKHLSGCMRYIHTLFTGSASELEPVLLDMGEYCTRSLATVIKAVVDDVAGRPAASKTPASGHDGLHVKSTTANVAVSRLIAHNAPLAVATLAMTQGTACPPDPGYHSAHLYSIFARPLSARLKVWKGKLNFKKHAQVISKGFFEAPGALLADITTESLSGIERPLLAPVTVVFAAVEGGGVLVHRKQEAARAIDNALGKIMQMLLLAMPDGYLSRQQAGVLKYMVAFREPAAAVRWCLMLQEVMHILPWSPSVAEAFAHLAARRSTPSLSGRRSVSEIGAHRRPSLKMGLADGVPASVLIDHLGHADYFGSSVNLAARFMDVAAGGGQIVTSIELAERVFSTWRYEAELDIVNLVRQGSWDLSLSGQASKHPANAAALLVAVACDSHGLVNSAERSFLQEQDASCYGSNLGVDNAAPDMTSSTMVSDRLEQAGTLLTTNSATADKQHIESPKLAAVLRGRQLHGGKASCYAHRLVHVSAEHIGTYAFKGCGAVDMVCFTSDAMLTQVQSSPAPKSVKGGASRLSGLPCNTLHSAVSASQLGTVFGLLFIE